MSETTAMETSAPESGTSRIKAIPQGLFRVSATEMWERFSFYGLSAILTFYMLASTADGGLGLNTAVAMSVVGAYGGAVYLAQLPGSWTADRLVAPRYLVMVGGSVIAFGHLALALIPGVPGLAIGLATVALGTGCLKTSVTAIVGQMYDSRSRVDRDSGFSYFYMAISVGSVMGPLLVGYGQSRWGYHIGFGIAAVGMIIALVQYAFTMKALPAQSSVVANPLTRPDMVRALLLIVAACGVLVAVVGLDLVSSENYGYATGAVIVIAFVAYMTTILRSNKASAAEKRRVRAYIPMWCATSLSYGIGGLIFTVVPLVVIESADMTVGSWVFPDAWVGQFANFGAVFTALALASFLRATRVGRAMSTTKYTIGFVMLATAWLLMITTSGYSGKTVPVLLIGLCLLIAGAADAFVGPVGLSLASRIAPENFKSQFIAIQILALGTGAVIYGALGVLYTKMGHLPFFTLLGALGLGAAFAIKLASPGLEQRFATAG